METVERELAKGVSDILSLICQTFVLCSGWLEFASFVCLFRLEMRSWALR